MYVLDQPDKGVIAKFGIKSLSTTEFVVAGLFQEWEARGKIEGKSGYYDWKFENGAAGRTTIEVLPDGSLKGHVVGSGLDWWFLAQRLNVAPSPVPDGVAASRAGVAPALDNEIGLLIAGAPVEAAAVAAKGEQLLVVAHWIRALALSGRLAEARAAGNRSKAQLGADWQSAIVFGLSRAGRIDEALVYAKGLSAQSRHITVRALIDAKRLDDALVAARGIPDDFQRGQELAAVATAMAKAGKIAEAARVAGEIKGEMTASFLQAARNAVVAAHVRAGRKADALAMVA